MPDWSYHPILKPFLFRLSAETARDLTFNALRILSGLPLGPATIDLLGHMRPPASLRQEAFGLTFPSPVGLGAGLDPNGVALRPFSQFGFGYIELGPVTAAAVAGPRPIERIIGQSALRYPDAPVNDGAGALARRLQRAGKQTVPVGIRLGHQPGATLAEATAERRQMIGQLAPFADFFVIDGWRLADAGDPPGDRDAPAWQPHLTALVAAAQPVPCLVALRPDLEQAAMEALLEAAVAAGVPGVVINDAIGDNRERLIVGPPARERCLAAVRAIRRRWGERLVILGAAGIDDPASALELLDAGAAFAQVHSGLVYEGPGLPKRINEAVHAARHQPAPPADPYREWPRQGWFWSMLLGVSLLFGGVLAGIIAATTVVLPYDEAFLGLSRPQIERINPYLLSFMAHDRLTLAGTMASIGILYTFFACYGMRYGNAWARQAILVSASVGFASLFLFLGFGYLDPLHAAVSILLFPFFLLGLKGELRLERNPAPPNLSNDRAWRSGLWGQLIFIILGVGLIGAGSAIMFIGVTSVFVPEDLGYMQTARDALQAVNARLIPLVAHDRAGFGGALVANGLGVLLSALWGFRQGARWLWWTLCLAGFAGFSAAIGVHLAVGYTDLWHLSPAFMGVALFVLGLLLAYPYLVGARQTRDHSAPAGP